MTTLVLVHQNIKEKVAKHVSLTKNNIAVCGVTLYGSVFQPFLCHGTLS